MITGIVEDKRTIKSIEKAIGGESYYYTISGSSKVTKIEAYYEDGQTAAVPWIAIDVEGKLYARMDATNCVIIYESEE